MTVKPGNPYEYQGVKVIALEPGPRNSRVLVVTEEKHSWVTRWVRNSLLFPLPSRYLQGAVPR